MRPLDAKTLEKLRKVWAMRSSERKGEVLAAENRAEHIVKAFGYALADVEGLLRAADAAQPAPQGRAGFRSYNMDDPVQKAAAAADYEDNQRARRRAEAPERAEVIRRYGSLENALSWQPNEQLLRAAVRKWSTLSGSGPDGRTQSIDGIDVKDYVMGRSVPKRVLSALSAAYPLPATITEAAAEYEFWTRRGRDLELVADFPMDEPLDFPCFLRLTIVERLIENGLRATSIAEILLRARHPGNQGLAMSEEVEEGLIEDLEHFAALEKAAGVHFGRAPGAHDTVPLRTATERRAEVKRLLSNVDTAHLSDREMARRVGVSPQTVGNIRRRM